MFALERQKRILEILKADGAVWVSRLALDLGVTEETIRRDLEKLETQEALIRTHGGAIPIDEKVYELSFEKRKKAHADIKEKLAAEAVKHILPWDTVFLDASTTTFYMAKEIKKLDNVTVITNSARIISELCGAERVKVIGVGGILSQNQSFVGSLAERTVADCYYANKMFFSSKGIMDNAWLLEGNEQECAIKQQMLNNAEEKYFMCDKSKIGRIGYVKLGPISVMDYFITEGEPDAALLARLDEHKIQTICVETA